MKGFGSDEKFLSGFSMEDDVPDDVDEVEEEVITNNYYEEEPELDEEEYYEDEEPYEDDYYDEPASVQPYDDRMEKILAELADLKKNIGSINTPATPAQPAQPQQAQFVQPQQIFTPIPFPMSPNHNQNNDMILNELSRLRDEHSRQQAVLEMNAQIAKLKEDFNKELQHIAARKEEARQERHDFHERDRHDRERHDRERERERERENDKETSKAILQEIGKLKDAILKIETENAEGAEPTRVLHPAVKGGKVSQLTVKANAIGNNLSKLNARVSDIGNMAGAPNKAVTDELHAIKKDISYLAELTSDIASASFSKLVTATADDGSTQIINIANDELMSRIKDIYTLIGNLGTKSAELSGQVLDVKRALGINVLCFKEDDGSFNYRPLEDKLAELKFLASSATAPANVKARTMLDFANLLKELPLGHRDDIVTVFEAVANLIKASPVNRQDGKLLCAETGNSGKSFALDKIFELKDSLAAADVSNYADIIRNIADYKNKVQNNSTVDSNQVLAEEISSTYDELVIADENNFDQISANLNELVEILTSVTVGDIIKIPDYKSFRPDKPTSDFGMITQLDNIKELIAQSNEQIFALDKFPMLFDRLGEVEARMRDFFTDPNKHYDILQEIAALKEDVLTLVNPVFETTVLADLQTIKEITENQLSPEEQIQLASDAAVVHDVLSQVVSLKDQLDTQVALMQDEKIVQDLEELHQRLDVLDDVDADVQEIRRKLEILDKIDVDISTLNAQLDTVKDELMTAVAIPNPEIMAEIANVRDEIFAYVDDLVPKLSEQLTDIKDDILAMNTFLGTDFTEKLDTLNERLTIFNDSLSADFADQISMLQAELASLNGSVGPELSELIHAIKDEVVKLNSMMNNDMNENFRVIKNDLDILKDNSTEIETLNELLQLREELNNYINREPDQSIPDEVYALREEILALSDMVSQSPVLQELEILKEKIEADTAATLDNIAQDIQTLKEQTNDSNQVVLEEIISSMADLKERLDRSASLEAVESLANELRDRLDRSATQETIESIALDIYSLKERSDTFASEETINDISREINSLNERIGALALDESINLLNDDVNELRTKLENLPVIETLERVMEEIDLIKENLEAASGKTVMEVKESLSTLNEEAAKKENIESIMTSLESLKEDVEHIMMTAAANAVQLEGIAPLTERADGLISTLNEVREFAEPLNEKLDVIFEAVDEIKQNLELLTEIDSKVEAAVSLNEQIKDSVDPLNEKSDTIISSADEIKETLDNIVSSLAVLVEDIKTSIYDHMETLQSEAAERHEQLETALKNIQSNDEIISEALETISLKNEEIHSAVDTVIAKGDEISDSVQTLDEAISSLREVADALDQKDWGADVASQLEVLQANLIDHADEIADSLFAHDELENINKQLSELTETLNEFSNRKTDPALLNELYRIQDILENFDATAKHDEESRHEANILSARSTNLIFDELSNLREQLSVKQYGVDPALAEKIDELREKIEKDAMSAFGGLKTDLDAIKKHIDDNTEAYLAINEEHFKSESEKDANSIERIDRLFEELSRLADITEERAILSVESENADKERIEKLMEGIEEVKAANADLLESIAGADNAVSDRIEQLAADLEDVKAANVELLESVTGIGTLKEDLESLTQDMSDAIAERLEALSKQIAESRLHKQRIEEDTLDETEAAVAEPMSISEEMADNILAIREQIEYNSNQYVLNNIADDLTELKEKIASLTARPLAHEEGESTEGETVVETADQSITANLDESINDLKAKLVAEIDARFEKFETAIASLKEDLTGANIFDSEVNAEDLENDPVMVELRSIKDEIIVQRDNQLAAQVLSAENTQELLSTIKAMQEEAYLNKGELDPEILQAVRDLKLALNEQNSAAKVTELRQAIDKINENLEASIPKDMFDRIVEQMDILHDEIVAIKLEQDAMNESALTTEQTDFEQDASKQNAAFERLSQQIDSIKDVVGKANEVTLDDVLEEINILRQHVANLNAGGVPVESSDLSYESAQKLDAITQELKIIAEHIEARDNELNAYFERAEGQRDTEDADTAEASEHLDAVLDKLELLKTDLDRLQEMQFESHSALSSFDNVSILDELNSIKEKLNEMPVTKSGIEQQEEIKKAFDEVKAAIATLKEDADMNRELYNSVKEIRLNAAAQALSDENSKVLFELFNEFKEELQNKGVKTLIEQDLNDSILEIKQDIVTSKADTDNHIIVEFNNIKEILTNLQSSVRTNEENTFSELSEKINVISETLSGSEELKELGDKLDAIRNTLNDSEEIKVLSDKLDSIRSTLSDSEEIRVLSDKLDSIRETLSGSDEIRNLSDKLDEIHEMLNDTNEFNKLKEQVMLLKENSLDLIRSEVEELKHSIGDLTVKQEDIHSVADRADENTDIVLAEILNLREHIEGGAQNTDAIGALRAEISELREQLTEPKQINELVELRQELAELKEQLAEPKQSNELVELKQELTELKKQLAEQSDIKALVDEIKQMREKKQESSLDRGVIDELLREIRTQNSASSIASTLSDEIRDVRTQVNLALVDNAGMSDSIKLINEQMARLISAIANYQPETAQIREIIRQELSMSNIGQPQFNEGKIIDEIAKLKAEMNKTSLEPVQLDNTLILEELSKLKEELSREKPSEFNRQLLEEIARIKDDIVAIGSKEIAPAAIESQESKDFTKSLNELKNELNEIASIVDIAKPSEPNREGRFAINRRGTSDDMDSEMPDPAESLKANLKAQKQATGGTARKKTTKSSAEQKTSTAKTKPEQKKPEAVKAQAKKTETLKAEPKRTQTKKTDAKRVEPKAEPKKVDVKIEPQKPIQKTEPKTKRPKTQIDSAITALPFDDESTPIDELSTADMLAKQVAHKLIMEQLVQQLGDGAVPQERVDELVTSILPEDGKMTMDEQSDSIKRIANQLVLEKLRESLNRKK